MVVLCQLFSQANKGFNKPFKEKHVTIKTNLFLKKLKVQETRRYTSWRLLERKNSKGT